MSVACTIVHTGNETFQRYWNFKDCWGIIKAKWLPSPIDDSYIFNIKYCINVTVCRILG